MLNFSKSPDGLLPVIIQDADTKQVLMLGYMDWEAYQKTEKEGIVTFFSRSKKRLWTKGETSGNFLKVHQILQDCDKDTLLIKAKPQGPVCHTGADTCFEEENKPGILFLEKLEKILAQRLKEGDPKSYTVSLSKEGINKVAQKVGEEAVETLIEAINGDITALREEGADLIYHLLLLLHHKGLSIADLVAVLERRHERQG
ncbi:MAG: bifunctional phosphoribosyl-AMP cyclohydrolase/phosphoribosyl-ATP diphosphatase HisIE [Bernardetiaceae bacterium]|nr:bifunctional phosphoribosyl-AMP cyclohydrolase/phosphoribosyl-ATP diphosphatase HisIE [Bernardetiaceae bacterium]